MTNKKEKNENIDINLQLLMARKKIKSVKDLSKLTGISPTILYDLSNEYKRSVRLDTLVKICRVLECEIGELVAIKKGQA